MSPCYSQLTLSDRRHLYQLKERKLPTAVVRAGRINRRRVAPLSASLLVPLARLLIGRCLSRHVRQDDDVLIRGVGEDQCDFLPAEAFLLKALDHLQHRGFDPEAVRRWRFVWFIGCLSSHVHDLFPHVRGALHTVGGLQADA
ncbi:hypothetical protein [Neorhizobium sp. T7_12]|jgi:hypothetical protein|uniref:hypothetical protein n=1 Tax=Neorhizobium sp. T7_12 TaxID=2093832 RepID=UPI000CFA1D11|nr:hypothetical protein [Neorhizobium sp. T7_12]